MTRDTRTAYQKGRDQRDEGGYNNPFRPAGGRDFVAFACGWGHRDAELWGARCALKARAHVGDI